jgi:hypothetical protein
MTDDRRRIELLDVPDLSKLTRYGVTIDAPTPTQFTMTDPWRPPGERADAPRKADSGPRYESAD